MNKIAVIAGAGPAGLTAALELLRRSEYRPLVFDLDSQVGGISSTVNYRGNRMDLGGHRFFSKSDWVMNWWQQILPVRGEPRRQFRDAAASPTTARRDASPRTDCRPATAGGSCSCAAGCRASTTGGGSSTIPIKLNLTTIGNLGLARTAAASAPATPGERVAPRRPETTLEDFFVNRFGDRLYRTFFKDYTEKVWGVPCDEISAEWGAQRVKGLSITSALARAGSLLPAGAGPRAEGSGDEPDRALPLPAARARPDVGGGRARSRRGRRQRFRLHQEVVGLDARRPYAAAR